MNDRPIARMLIALLVLAAAGYGLYFLGRHHAADQMQATTSAPPGASTKKPLYWHDPMVPGQRFDKPGKSPFMDMELVPVYADDGATETGNGPASEGKVTISPQVQQNLGIRTAEVTIGRLEGDLVTVGSISYNERDTAVVQARANGFVERLHVRAPLDPVKKGQALAEVYVPDWVAAQEEYLTVKRMQGNGLDMLVDAARQRMRLVGMTDDQIRRTQASGTVQPRITLTAPMAGVVTELTAREGMSVMAGAPLFRISGLQSVWVNADVPENSAAQVRPGTSVEARTPALPGTVFKGKVSAILPEINQATRTIKARVELANPSLQLVPGMFATLSFSRPARADVPVVPSESVIRTGTRSVVMVALPEGRFQAVDVETGAEANGRTEIREGLRAGQRVVVSGQFLIDSEASLKGVTASMTNGTTAASVPPPATTESVPTHHGEGKVERIEKDQITLSHGPITSLKWGDMTMGFKPPAAGVPADLAVGDRVRFEFRARQDGQFEIVGMTRLGAPAPNLPGGAKQ